MNNIPYQVGSVYHLRLSAITEFVQCTLTRSMLDIEDWFTVNYKTLQLPNNIVTYQDFLAIRNSKACVLGWAGLLPEFQEQGLHVILKTHNSLIHPVPQTYQQLTVQYNDLTFFDAGQEFFGLTNADTHYVFNCAFYDRHIKITPEVVGSRLTSILEKFNNGY